MCLFFNAELPQDPKSRSSQSIQTGGSGSDESLNTSSNTLTSGNLTKDQSSLSHPDLSEIHKTRAATLPARGFRTGKHIYFNFCRWECTNLRRRTVSFKTKKKDGLFRRADGKLSVICLLLRGNCLSLFLTSLRAAKTRFKERKRPTITRQKTTHSIVVWTKRGFNFVVLLNELVNFFPVQTLSTELTVSLCSGKELVYHSFTELLELLQGNSCD